MIFDEIENILETHEDIVQLVVNPDVALSNNLLVNKNA